MTKDCNSGNWNSGDWNSGDWNSGHQNSGYCNSGHQNSGNWNSGNQNSGDQNSGHWNSGDCNSGNRNSGNWNSGNWNLGYFNTDEPCVRIFNKQTTLKRTDIAFPSWMYFSLTKWINEENMTDEEKKEHASYKEMKGYLRTFSYKEAWKLAFENATKEGVQETVKLPHFNYDIFEEITGITKRMIQKKLKEQTKMIKNEYDGLYFDRDDMYNEILDLKRDIRKLQEDLKNHKTIKNG